MWRHQTAITNVHALWQCTVGELERLSAAGKDAKVECGMPYMLMTRDLCGVQSTVAQHCLLLPAVGGCDISCGVLHGRCVLPGIRLHSHPCVFAPVCHLPETCHLLILPHGHWGCEQLLPCGSLGLPVLLLDRVWQGHWCSYMSLISKIHVHCREHWVAEGGHWRGSVFCTVSGVCNAQCKCSHLRPDVL